MIPYPTRLVCVINGNLVGVRITPSLATFKKIFHAAKWRNSPGASSTVAIPFSSISALSFHTMLTYVQPIIPVNESIKSNSGLTCADLIEIAQIKITD